jgi:hypothetical protein
MCCGMLLAQCWRCHNRGHTCRGDPQGSSPIFNPDRSRPILSSEVITGHNSFVPIDEPSPPPALSPKRHSLSVRHSCRPRLPVRLSRGSIFQQAQGLKHPCHARGWAKQHAMPHMRCFAPTGYRLELPLPALVFHRDSFRNISPTKCTDNVRFSSKG